MIKGYFNYRGELFFEMDLIGVDSSIVTMDAMLDTGFTDWLAMNIQDRKFRMVFSRKIGKANCRWNY